MKLDFERPFLGCCLAFDVVSHETDVYALYQLHEDLLVDGAGQLQALGHLRVLVANHEVDDIENQFGTVKVEFNVDMADKVRNQAVNFKLLSVVFFQMQIVGSCQDIKKQRLKCLQRIQLEVENILVPQCLLKDQAVQE